MKKEKIQTEIRHKEMQVEKQRSWGKFIKNKEKIEMKLDKRKCRGRKNINTQMDYRVDREGKNEKKEREKERDNQRE